MGGNVSAVNWEGYIRRLMYPVLFKTDLLGEIDRVIHLNAHVYTRKTPPRDYIAAIRYALNSKKRIANLLAFSQSEESLRAFLAEMLRRLEMIVSDDRFDGNWPRLDGR